MNAIIVGCGRAGAELAEKLFRLGHHVSVIDVVSQAFDNLPSDFRGHVIQGDILSQDVLTNAGIEEAHCLAALTNSDTLNAVVSHIARSHFKVPAVVARNYDPRWAALHEAFELQTINSIQWSGEQLLEIVLHGNARRVYEIDERIAIYRLELPAAWSGKQVSDLLAGTHALPVTLTREGVSEHASSDAQFALGDALLVSATIEEAAVLRERLQKGA
jgi:trk system potassium uptake protein TrkA